MQLPWTRQDASRYVDTKKINLPKVEVPKVDVEAAVTDTRRAVSEGADHIVAVAADLSREASKVGREASREAAKLSREASREAGKLGREAGKLGREAAKKASELAVTGEATLRTIGSDVRAAADDLRSYRVVKQGGLDWRPAVALFAGISAGIAAMFFFDPEHGRRRRVLLMDQLRKWLRLSSEWLDGTARDVRNRSIGIAHEMRKAAEGATESVAASSERATEEMVATTPDVSGQLTDTEAAAGADPSQPTFAGDRTH